MHENTNKENNNVRHILLKTITETANNSGIPIDEDATFEKNGIEEVDLVKAILTIESDYNIELYDDELDNLTTPSALITYVLDVINNKEHRAA